MSSSVHKKELHKRYKSLDEIPANHNISTILTKIPDSTLEKLNRKVVNEYHEMLEEKRD